MLSALVRRLLTPKARRQGRQPLPRRAFRPRLEWLEERAVPTVVTWINPGDGDWSVGANWSTSHVPGSGDDVVINTPVTVTHSVDSDSVHSLNESAGAGLVLSGGSLAF